MDNKLIAAVATIVLVSATIGGAIILLNDGDSQKKIANYSGDTPVFGNANNDRKIDNEDVSILEKLINDGNYNTSDYPFADANQDGRITAEDVTIVKNIIAGKPTEIMYKNYFGDICTVHYPITGTIGTNYWQQAEIMTILGLWDRVAAVDNQTIKRTNQYPGIADLKDLGSRDSMTSETILASGISALICHGNSSSTTETLIADFENAGRTIDIICLGWEGMNCLSTATMLGIFFQCSEKADKYVDWCNGILDRIKTKVDTIEEEDRHTMVINLMYASQTNNIKIECEGTGSYSLLSQICKTVDLEEATYATKHRATKSAEWFIEENKKGTFDYIMIMEEGTGLSAGQPAYNARFEQSLTYLNQTEAYKLGQIGGTTYGFGGFSGFSLLLYAAYMVYPQLFTEEEGLETMDEWYENFTFMDIKSGDFGWHYTGTSYAKYSERLSA